MFNLLELGTNNSSDCTNGFWCIDPVDGTKGFIRGDQYAVCLAYVSQEGEPLIGVLGCPNLDDSSGVLIFAVRDQGAFQVKLVDKPCLTCFKYYSDFS